MTTEEKLATVTSEFLSLLEAMALRIDLHADRLDGFAERLERIEDNMASRVDVAFQDGEINELHELIRHLGDEVADLQEVVANANHNLSD